MVLLAQRVQASSHNQAGMQGTGGGATTVRGMGMLCSASVARYTVAVIREKNRIIKIFKLAGALIPRILSLSLSSHFLRWSSSQWRRF